MATPLDFFSILKQTEPVFQFMLVVFMTYVLFTQFAPAGLKEKKNLAGILAFVLGVLTLFSPIAARTISLAMPAFALLFIFLVFTLLAFYSLGVEGTAIKSVIQSRKYGFITFIIVGICLGIVALSLGKAVTEQGGFGVQNAQGQEAEFYKTVFHPKILGMLFVLMVAFFTIQRLGVPPEG